MKYIVTLTLNPAIDKSSKVQQLLPEEKLRCDDPVYQPGGGGVNVSRAIKKLGGDSLAIYTAGGHTGILMQELLTAEGVSQQIVPIAGRTRENFIILEKSTHYQYRFGMNGPVISEDECNLFLETVRTLDPKPDYLVASGSLPANIPPYFMARVAQIAKDLGAKFIVDTSGEALKLAAQEGAYLLKPNLKELATLTGNESITNADVEPLARQLIDNGHCEVVVVSLGGKGAILVSKDVVETVEAPPVKVNSTVGAGDSMVAGMILSLAQGKDLRDMVRYGVACGSAATMNEGTDLCKRTDVEQLYKQIVDQAKLAQTGA